MRRRGRLLALGARYEGVVKAYEKSLGVKTMALSPRIMEKESE
jgi:hypothetical protein